jgi:foldase protein PrsA
MSSERPSRMRRALAALMPLTLIAALTGCGGGSANSATPTSGAASPTATRSAAKIPSLQPDPSAKHVALPAKVVATVGGAAVTQTQFDRLFNQATKGLGGNAIPLDPPRYAHCATALRHQQAQMRARFAKLTARFAKKSGKTPALPANHTNFKTQCAARRAGAIQSAMSQLIQAHWTEQQAKAAGITVSNAEIDAAIARQRKIFPSQAKWDAYLKRTGQSASDLRARTRLMLLTEKLSAKRTASAPKVSDAQVDAYFSKHQQQFGFPERRDLQVILTKTAAQAQQAKAAIANGMTWTGAVKRYSTDPVSKHAGGAMPSVVAGSRDPGLTSLAFHLKQGQLAGPAKGASGYWLVRVTKIIPAVKPQLGPYRDRIRQLLGQQALGKQLQAAAAAQQQHLRATTLCRPGFVVSLCANAAGGGKR